MIYLRKVLEWKVSRLLHKLFQYRVNQVTDPPIGKIDILTTIEGSDSDIVMTIIKVIKISVPWYAFVPVF